MSENDSHSLPSGYPDRLSGPLTWTGSEMESNPDLFCTYILEDDFKHIGNALQHFKNYLRNVPELGLARGFASPENFPLPESLAQRLHGITDSLYSSSGFRVLRGLDLSRYTDDERVILYAGLTSYVADIRARNIDHIWDRTKDSPPKEKLKPPEQTVSMTFHTDIDVYDILTMFTQSVPLEGGHQYLASMASIYNVLAVEDPAVLETLAKEWYWERSHRPDIDVEEVRSFWRPLISLDSENRVQVNFASAFIGGSGKYPLSSAAPTLERDQLHALEALQAAARRVCVRLVPQPGDILFVNNYALLHARDSWVDSETDPEKRRYMMRLWLHDTEKGWMSASGLKRDMSENFDLPPEKQALMTGSEWKELPRSWRVKSLGVSGNDCHD